MPCWGDGFSGRNGDGFSSESWGGEDATVSNNDGYKEKGTGEVAKEGEGPMRKHFHDGGAAVEGGERGILYHGILAKVTLVQFRQGL